MSARPRNDEYKVHTARRNKVNECPLTNIARPVGRTRVTPAAGKTPSYSASSIVVPTHSRDTNRSDRQRPEVVGHNPDPSLRTGGRGSCVVAVGQPIHVFVLVVVGGMDPGRNASSSCCRFLLPHEKRPTAKRTSLSDRRNVSASVNLASSMAIFLKSSNIISGCWSLARHSHGVVPGVLRYIVCRPEVLSASMVVPTDRGRNGNGIKYVAGPSRGL
jgi:hypothetical protein